MPDFCNRRFPFRFTTALNLLMKMGVDIDRVNLLAVGEFENYCGEIREQSPAPGTVLDENTQISLKVGFPSPVDYMPYQFFYGLEGGRDRSGEWEDRARELFAPYDAAVIRHHAIAKFEILKFNHSFLDLEHILNFLRLFDYAFESEDEQLEELLAWMALLPNFHFWAGNPTFVERALERIFGYKFAIVENVKSEYEIPPSLRYQLGSPACRLGRETIIGKSFLESDSCYTLVVSGIPGEKVKDFLPGMKLRKKLEKMLEVCMPNNLDYKLEFRVEEKKLFLGKEKGRGYLGYSTYV
jgi:hypothetical protein